MIEVILTILNHPLTWIGVIALPTVIVFKHFFRQKLAVFNAKARQEKTKDYQLNSIAGKVEFALNNTELAYSQLMKTIKDNKNALTQTNDPNAKKVFQSSIKDAELQLKIVTKIMEHRQVIDMFKPIIIPTIDKIEKTVMSKIKGGLNF